MYIASVVLDHSALIPCGDKPEREKECIRRFGNFEDLLSRVVIYVSRYWLNVYRSSTSDHLRKHSPLPLLQASLERAKGELLKVVARSRGFIYRERKFGSLTIHVVATSELDQYNVSGLGLKDEEDIEVLRLALHAARVRKTYLVTTDVDFTERLNVEELKRRYPFARNIVVGTPCGLLEDLTQWLPREDRH